MKPQINIGQIFLIHQKDANFTLLYQETLKPKGETPAAELFAVFEIGGLSHDVLKSRKKEYEKLAQLAASALKRTYESSPLPKSQDTFERALAAINNALSRLASNGKVTWYGKLNITVASLVKNELSFSATGNGTVHLLRDGNLTLISEGLAESVSRPLKIFSNFSSGRILAHDRVLLGTSQLLNYMSAERLKEFLAEDTVAEACQEIIAILSDIKTVGFSAFIFGPDTTEKSEAVPAFSWSPTARDAGKNKNLQTKNLVPKILGWLWVALAALGRGIFWVVRFVLKFIYGFFRRRPKKYLFWTIGIILLILAVNIANALWQKNHTRQEERESSTVSELETKLDEAEAAIIYNDEGKIIAILPETERLLQSLSGKLDAGKQSALSERIATLRAKVGKELKLENVTALTQFPTIPTDLYRSPNGFLALNRDSHTLSFYDFRAGTSSRILQNQNLGAINLATTSDKLGYLFWDKNGKVFRLSLPDEDLQPLEDLAENGLNTLQNSQIKNLMILDSAGETSRLYLLDAAQNQIWRARVTSSKVESKEQWLKTATDDFGQAKHAAIDGNIYVLYPDRADKYFNGQKQNFALSSVYPPLKNAVKIFTGPALQNLYILDSEKNRVLVFTKQGALKHQIVSEKFRDLADLFVDEPGKIIYLLSGSELLQVNY